MQREAVRYMLPYSPLHGANCSRDDPHIWYAAGTAFTKASQVCVECKARKPPDAFSVRAATGNLFAKCKQCSRQACRARWEALGPPTASNYGARRAAAAAEHADPSALMSLQHPTVVTYCVTQFVTRAACQDPAQVCGSSD